MGIQEESIKYIASLVDNCGATQDEINNLSFDDEAGFFESNRLADWFVNQVNFGWRVWQAKAVTPALTDKMICAIESTVENQLKASGINSDPFRIDGEKIWNSAIEAQELSNDS